MSNRLSVGFPVILFIALLTILLAGPFWQIPGLPGSTIDTFMHLHRSAAVARAFEEGVFWPRWYPAIYNGLGAPTFHHYSPGLYWLVASVHGVGLGLDQALKLVVTVALILAGCGTYAWLRFAFSPVASLVGCAMYLLHPHILTRAFYYEGSLARLLGLLLLPVCLWAITALHMRSRILYWLTAVASMAAIVLIHTPTAVIGAFVLFSYWLLMAAGYRKSDGLLRSAVAALLAVMLTAAYWLPALADKGQVLIDSVRHGLFQFQSRFLFLNWWHLVSFQSPILDSRAGNPPISLLTWNFGAASWLAVAAGLASAVFGDHRARRVWALSGCFFTLAVLALTLSVSEPLWESIAPLRLLPFPYRLLGVASLGALPASAAAIDMWPTDRRAVPALILVMAAFLTLFPYLFPSHTSRTPFRQVQRLTVEDTQLYEKTSNFWGTTAFNEYLVQKADMGVITGQTTEPKATKVRWRSTHEAVADLSSQIEPMLLRLHFHPGWSAGERAVLTPGPAGWMQVSELDNPEQPLLVRWEGTSWQRWGERTGLLGLSLFVGCILFLTLRRLPRYERSEISDVSRTRSAVVSGSTHRALIATVGLVFILVVARTAVDLFSDGPFLLHSKPGKLAFAVDGQPVTLGDDSSPLVTLLGWELVSGSAPRPGGVVRVRLYWQSHSHITEELHSFLHLYSHSLQRSWAVDNIRIGGIPDSRQWEPDKYYVDDLRLSLPSDLPPLTYSLVAGLASASRGRLTVPGSPNGVLELKTVDVAPTRPGLFQKEWPTTGAQAVTSDGLRLQGYDLLLAPDAPTLRIFWETSDGIATDWITYVHLEDDQGTRVAQFDGPALDGLQPTSQWHTNALYIDRRQLHLPAELEEGDYLLRIGLFNVTTGERLPFHPDNGGEDHFTDGQLLIPLTIETSRETP